MQPTILKHFVHLSSVLWVYTLLGHLIVQAPAKMNWLAKLQALWMSWLYLSSARHTVCLCLSPLRMRSGMPPMWTKTRPSTDGPNCFTGVPTCQRQWLCCIKGRACATAWIHNLNSAIYGWHQRPSRFWAEIWNESHQIKSNQIKLHWTGAESESWVESRFEVKQTESNQIKVICTG